MQTKPILIPKQIASDPQLFAATFLKILDKQKRLIPFRWNAAQRKLFSELTGHDIILKSRQLGMTTLINGEIFRQAVTRTTNALTLTHSGDATAKLRLMADRFYEHCKFNTIQPQREVANASITTFPEFDSVVSISTAGSLHTGRGETFTIVHGSEIAFWPDAQKILSGAMQGGNPSVILESTPNGAGGTFFNMCMDALSGRSIWKLHFFPWFIEPEYSIALDDGEKIHYNDDEKQLVKKHKLTPAQIKWRREKQIELGRFFIQEYPEDEVSCFLTSGNSYFGDTSQFFTAPIAPAYNPAHEYFAGLDFGQTVDFTSMTIFDKTVKQQVDLLHINKLEWREQRARIAAKYSEWHCQSVLAEWNSIGGPNTEALRGSGLNVFIFKTSNASKAGLMSAYNEALHSGLQLQDLPVQWHELNTFVSKQSPLTGVWQLQAEGQGHDDTVISGALAFRACSTGFSADEIGRYERGEINATELHDTLPDDLKRYMEQSGVK